MIRLVGKKLIIPRGDTGSFSVPLVTTFDPSDKAIFSILDEKTQTVVIRIECDITQEALTVNFAHDKTVNLPVGKYYWDIKSYKNSEIVDGELVDGTEVDSYYAAYSLPVCEIRQTGDNLLVADESPNTTLTSQSINMLQAVTNEVVNARTRAQTAATNAENNATTVEDILSQITQLGAEAITLQSNENATASYNKNTGLLTIGVPKGSVPNFTIGEVTEGAQADASITGTDLNPVLNLTLPNANVPTKISQLENDSGYVLNNDMILIPGTGDNSLKVRDTILSGTTYSNEASGLASFVEGMLNTVSANMSHAEGQQNTVTRGGSHAEGYKNTVQAIMSHAEGAYNHIQGNGVAHVEGIYVTAFGQGAHAEGNGTIAHGTASHAQGHASIANGNCSHAEGNGSIANTFNSHAEGTSSKALGNAAHAEGTYTVAAGHYSHTENNHTLALGTNAHAQNNGEILSLKITGEANATTYSYSGTGDPSVGNYITSHENYARIISVDTTNKQFTVDKSLVYASNEESLYIYRSGAFGDNSHVEGKSTTAMGNEQHVQGKYNAIDSAGTYADIVGNGTAHDARANAYALTWTGDGKYAGDVYVHADSNSTNGVKVATINDIPSVPVQDVQVNGTSILDAQGVANVPVASGTALGVVKTGEMGIAVNSNNGEIYTVKASSAQAKTGTANFTPIVPSNQHESTFYGLTKAAGVDMASSSNPVGQYTEEAKIAIQKMLGIYQAPWELIQDYEVQETTKRADITVDANGIEFSLSEAIVVIDMKAGANSSNGVILINSLTTGISGKPYVTLQNVFATSDQTRHAHLLVSGGKFIGEASGSNTNVEYSNAYLVRNRNAFGLIDADDIHHISLFSLNNHAITVGTKITVYGRRKWQ